MCKGVLTQEFLHRSCHTGGLTQEFLHRSCYTGVLTQEFLHRSCYTGVLTKEFLHTSCYAAVLTLLGDLPVPKNSYKTPNSQVLLNSPFLMRRPGQPKTGLRSATLCGGDRACRTHKFVMKCEFEVVLCAKAPLCKSFCVRLFVSLRSEASEACDSGGGLKHAMQIHETERWTEDHTTFENSHRRIRLRWGQSSRGNQVQTNAK